MEKDWQCIFTCSMIYKAEIAKAVLLDQNIESIIMDKQSSPYSITIGEVEVYVKQEDVILAKIILDEAQL
ncbi:MAG: DUF2007 domain-containing protein [Bacteroidetes bacterium]|nr:DUF2007 domain-containing protein [Bacteroidota bacterium]